MWARVAVGAALIVGVGRAALAGAQADAPAARLVILEPVPQAVFERIAGQTSDLPWLLVRAAVGGGGDRLQHAVSTAVEQKARAVAWITRDPSSAFVLKLYDPQRQRLLERRFALERGAGALAESAALETLALSVRSLLRALAADEAVGEAVATSSGVTPPNSTARKPSAAPSVTPGSEAAIPAGETTTAGQGAGEHPAAARAQPEPTRSVSADDDAEPAASEPRSTASEPRSTAIATAIVLGAGWDVALDGQSPLQQGPLARLGFAIGAIELAAQLETGLKAELIDTQTRVSLQRRAALLNASLTFLHASRLALALGIAAGAASFARATTEVIGPGLSPKPAVDLLAFALGLGLRARLELLSGSSASFGLELESGAWILPAAPVLRYQSSAGRVDRRLWPVQPHLHLGPYLKLEL